MEMGRASPYTHILISTPTHLTFLPHFLMTPNALTLPGFPDPEIYLLTLVLLLIVVPNMKQS